MKNRSRKERLAYLLTLSPQARVAKAMEDERRNLRWHVISNKINEMQRQLAIDELARRKARELSRIAVGLSPTSKRAGA